MQTELISNLINKLRLHQFLGTKGTETNKLLKTDANEWSPLVRLLMSRKTRLKLDGQLFSTSCIICTCNVNNVTIVIYTAKLRVLTHLVWKHMQANSDCS